MLPNGVLATAASAVVPRVCRPRVIDAAASAACQTRPLPASLRQVMISESSRRAQFSSAVVPEEASGNLGERGGQREGGEKAYSMVRHPPAQGWKYPPIPKGLEAKFAVFKMRHTQFKVTKDDLIITDKVREAEVGTTLEMDEVLLVGTPEYTKIGRPLVPGAVVKLFVEQQTKDKKILVFKKRRRKGSKTTKGHRRDISMLRVTDITS